VLILCAIELAMLGPLLDRMLADQAAGRFELDTVTPVALVVIVFSLAILASTRAAATIARGIRLPRQAYSSVPAATAVTSATSSEAASVRLDARNQAASPVARALESAARRDQDSAAGRAATMMRLSRDGAASSPTMLSTAGGVVAPQAATAARVSAAPRTRLPRASRAAARRDL
jgi:hypothetical protein